MSDTVLSAVAGQNISRLLVPVAVSVVFSLQQEAIWARLFGSRSECDCCVQSFPKELSQRGNLFQDGYDRSRCESVLTIGEERSLTSNLTTTNQSNVGTTTLTGFSQVLRGR